MYSDAARTLLGVVVADTAILAVVVLIFWVGVFVSRRFGNSGVGYGLKALGFKKPKVGYMVGVALGLAVGVGALLTGFILTPLTFLAADRLGFSTESRVQQPLMRSVGDWVSENPGTAIPAAIFVMVIFAPAVEEIIFRGAVFGGLYRLGAFLSRRNLGAKPESPGGTLLFVVAAILSSAFFAALHFEPIVLPTLLVLAVALCALYWKTGSLLAPFVAHATFNSFAVLFIILGGLDVLPTLPQPEGL